MEHNETPGRLGINQPVSHKTTWAQVRLKGGKNAMTMTAEYH